MNHTAFVREMLDHESFKQRMTYLVATDPYLLTFLPEEERWTRLEAAVREYGTSIDWFWPWHTMKWSLERTKQLVRTLIQDPELAGGFLSGARAESGWLIFWDLQEFLEVMKQAMALAPYDACLKRTWIATAIGDRLVNGDRVTASFMNPIDIDDDPWYGWWCDPDHRAHREFGGKGDAQAVALINEAFTHPGTSLSRFSQLFFDRLGALTHPYTYTDACRLAELLLILPDGAYGQHILQCFVDACPLDKLGMTYRWLITIERLPSRTRLYTLTELMKGRYATDLNLKGGGDTRVRKSWIEPAMWALMLAKGWRFKTLEFHRNKKFDEQSDRAFDAQITLCERGERMVFTFDWRGLQGTGDYHPRRPGPVQTEVMVPPEFVAGLPVYQDRAKHFAIYRAPHTFLLARRWEHEYTRRFR